MVGKVRLEGRVVKVVLGSVTMGTFGVLVAEAAVLARAAAAPVVAPLVPAGLDQSALCW